MILEELRALAYRLLDDAERSRDLEDVDNWLNLGAMEIYREAVRADLGVGLTSATVSYSAASKSGSLPPDLYQLKEVTDSSDTKLEMGALSDIPRLRTGLWVNPRLGPSRRFFVITGDSLRILPDPAVDEELTIYYYPVLGAVETRSFASVASPVVGDAVASMVAPGPGKVVSVTATLATTGTAGSTTIQVRDTRLSPTDPTANGPGELFADDFRPVIAATDPDGKVVESADLQNNRDIQQSDTLALDVDTVATGAATLSVSLRLMRYDKWRPLTDTGDTPPGPSVLHPLVATYAAWMGRMQVDDPETQIWWAKWEREKREALADLGQRYKGVRRIRRSR